MFILQLSFKKKCFAIVLMPRFLAISDLASLMNNDIVQLSTWLLLESAVALPPARTLSD
jgi:hypothetical protein